jgi:arylsulfatase A-like enzyme
MIEAGRETDHLSAFWDVSPTLLELAGAKPQEDTDGLSMVPVLLGKGDQGAHDYLYWEFYERGGKRAILKGKWKMILYKTNTDLNPRVELFNCQLDPSEQNNVAAQHPEVVSELQRLMDDAHSPSEHQQFKLAAERQ